MPNFWDDQKAAEKQMRKVKELHYWIDSYEDIERWSTSSNWGLIS